MTGKTDASGSSTNNLKVSYGRTIANSKYVDGITSLSMILEEIKINEGIKKIQEEIKNIEGNEAQQEFKKNNLPYFIGATFKNNRKKRSEAISSQIMIFDYDDLSEEAVKEKREVLVKDPSVLCVFKSPRGWLKVIYLLQEEITDYKRFSSIYKYYAGKFNASLGIEPGKTSDITRACFLSFDPEIYVNPDAEPLEIEIPEEENNAGSAKINFSDFEKPNIEVVKAAVKYLKENVELGYDDWIKCGFALTTIPEGRELFIDLSANEFYDDSVEEINSKFDNLKETATGEIGIGTLIKIAQDNGFEYEHSEKGRLPLHLEMLKRFEVDDTRDPNKLLGYPLTKFKQMAEHIDGVQPGLYFIAAEPNIGKTALLMNLTLDIIETNPETTVIYFSLDDDRTKIAYRLLSILCNLHIKDVRRGTNIAVNRDLITEKRKILIELLATERLMIPDLADVNQIEQLGKFLNENFRENLVICIDGLYNLEIPGKDGIRVENIGRANAVKFIVDKLGIPVFVTGELRKKMKGEGKNKKPTIDDLMESGKYAYNASVVWLLYAEEYEDNTYHIPTLNLEYTKNKVSEYKGVQQIIFNRIQESLQKYPIFILQVNQLLITEVVLFEISKNRQGNSHRVITYIYE